jgi:hypothetical protein
MGGRCDAMRCDAMRCDAGWVGLDWERNKIYYVPLPLVCFIHPGSVISVLQPYVAVTIIIQKLDLMTLQ